jgi:hypothetical protein
VKGVLVAGVPVCVAVAVSVGGRGLFVLVGRSVAVFVGASVAVGSVSWVGEAGTALGSSTAAEGVGLVVCSKNVGMHALKKRDRLKTNGSNFFITQLLLRISFVRQLP